MKRINETPRYKYYCQNAKSQNPYSENRFGRRFTVRGDRKVATRWPLGETKKALQYHDQP